MSEKKNMQDVWAATDKPLIDRMKTRTFEASRALNSSCFTSSEDSSASDSDNISEASFLAVPREFRPNLADKQSPVLKTAKIQSSNKSLVQPQVSQSDQVKSTNNQASLNSIRSFETKTNFTLNKVDTTEASYNRLKSLRKSIKDQAQLNSLSTHDSNIKAERSSNFTYKKHETGPLKTKWLSSKPKELSKENSASTKTDAEKKMCMQKEVAIEVVIPRNDNEYLQIFDKTRASKEYTGKTQMHTRSLLNHDPEILASINKKKNEKAIEFECINVSEHLKISRNKTLELDVANLTLDIKTSRKLMDSSKFQVLPNDKKNIHTTKKKNKKSCNYSNSNACPNKKQLSNSSVKWQNDVCLKNSKQSSDPILATKNKTEGYVKWHDTTGLNNCENAYADHAISATQIKSSKIPDKTVKWTVTHEENTFFSDAGLSTNDEGDGCKERKSYELFDKYETKNLNLNQNFSKGVKQLESKYVNNDTGCMKQQKYNTLGEIDYLENYSHKDNINKRHDLRTNKNIEMVLCKKEDDCSITAVTKNTFEHKSYPNSYFNKASELSDKMNETNQRIQYEQLAKNNVQPVSLPKKDLNNKTAKNVKPTQEQNLLIKFGKEISDLIIGSHTTLSTLFSIYEEWKTLRCELIDQFKQLEKTIYLSSKKYKMYQDVLEVGSGIAAVASNIPHPYLGMASKIVSILTSLASKFFATSRTQTVNHNIDDPEITRLLIKDMANSSELYMHGLQCNLQFEETMKVIEEFHSNATISDFADTKCPYVLTFIEGVLEYRPQHRIFYKKLHKCFQELLQNGTTQFSKQFCEPFSLYATNAVDVVGYLNWRFVEVDNASVEQELNGILCLIESSSSTSMQDIALKISNCIKILSDELESVMKSISKVPIFEFSHQNLCKKNL